MTKQAKGPHESVIVRVGPSLESVTSGQRTIIVPLEGEWSVRDVLRALVQRFPGLVDRLLDDRARLLRFVCVFRNDEDVRALEGLDTAIEGNDEVTIVQAMAGG